MIIQVDWKKAADEFGSASVESFRKMVQTAFKKVSAAEANGGAAPAATPRGKKRKNDGDGEGEGPKKKGGRKAKKATTPITGESPVLIRSLPCDSADAAQIRRMLRVRMSNWRMERKRIERVEQMIVKGVCLA